ncbi:MAG: TonB C-terminal domain-containing protein [Burkholderiales bacterium]
MSWGNCYEKAGELCQSLGYDVIDKLGDQGGVITGSQYGLFGGTVTTRTLIIQCKPELHQKQIAPTGEMDVESPQVVDSDASGSVASPKVSIQDEQRETVFTTLRMRISSAMADRSMAKYWKNDSQMVVQIFVDTEGSVYVMGMEKSSTNRELDEHVLAQCRRALSSYKNSPNSWANNRTYLIPIEF